MQATKRDLVLTSKTLFLIGREKIKKGPKKGQVIEVVKRRIPIETIQKVTVSTKQVAKLSRIPIRLSVAYLSLRSDVQDDFIVFHVNNDYDTLLQSIFKTELLSTLNKKLKEGFDRTLNLHFNDS